MVGIYGAQSEHLFLHPATTCHSTPHFVTPPHDFQYTSRFLSHEFFKSFCLSFETPLCSFLTLYLPHCLFSLLIVSLGQFPQLIHSHQPHLSLKENASESSDNKSDKDWEDDGGSVQSSGDRSIEEITVGKGKAKSVIAPMPGRLPAFLFCHY
jgi:hypothetical protein